MEIWATVEGKKMPHSMSAPEADIVPCPTCNRKHDAWVVLRGAKAYQVVCHGCHTSGPLALNEFDAVVRWNAHVCP